MKDYTFAYRRTATRITNAIYEVTDYGKIGLKVIADINCDRKLFTTFGLELDAPVQRGRKRYAKFIIPRALLDENGKVASDATRSFLMMVYRPF